MPRSRWLPCSASTRTSPDEDTPVARHRDTGALRNPVPAASRQAASWRPGRTAHTALLRAGAAQRPLSLSSRTTGGRRAVSSGRLLKRESNAASGMAWASAAPQQLSGARSLARLLGGRCLVEEAPDWRTTPRRSRRRTSGAELEPEEPLQRLSAVPATAVASLPVSGAPRGLRGESSGGDGGWKCGPCSESQPRL